MKPRFLLDENLPPHLKTALLHHDESIDVLRVGDSGAPPLATPDPLILRYVDTAQRCLVTDNRHSMPGHLESHWAADGHIWGLVWIRPKASIGQIARALYVIWSLSEVEDWLDRLDWIPW
jgi:hypothetical protein